MPDAPALPPRPPHRDDWLTRDEAAVWARVSVSTLDRERRAGRLQSVKPDGKRLFRRGWIDDWLETYGGLAVVLLAVSMLVCTACPRNAGVIDHALRELALKVHLRA